MRTLQVVVVGLVVLGIAAMVSPGYASISGSAHDLSSQSWNTSNDLCAVCHTPHFSDTSVVGAPLWDRELTASTFTPYDSSTLDSTPGQPAGISKLCLSCHDGTVALENYGGISTGTNFVTGTANLSADLTDDHPISFTFDSNLQTADGELNDPASISLPLFGASDDQLECASCHDVHNTATVAAPLLLIDNAGGALCLECHAK